MYPDNLKAATLAKMMEDRGGCVTPFAKNQNFTCLTMENATKSLMNAKQIKDSSSYSLSCNTIKTEILLDSATIFLGEQSNLTFIFNLPSTVVSTHSSFSYSFLSFTAEFGSWFGLLTGVAFVQVSENGVLFISYLFQVTEVLQLVGSWLIRNQY